MKTRGVLTDARLQSDVNRIKEYYARSGRSGARSKPATTPLARQPRRRRLRHHRRRPHGRRHDHLRRQQAFSSAHLTRIIQTRTTNWLSWLNKQDIYSEEKLQADQELLRRYYLQHGYADFQILGADAAFDAANGKYVVTFTVDEGPKYTFGDDQRQLVDPGRRSCGAGQGRAHRERADLQRDRGREERRTLTIELSRLGYVFAQVRPRGDRDYTNNIISLTYVVDEGPRAYVERIEIRGNTKTRDYVIRREFDISEGDAYNRVLVDRAERRLRNLGFFKKVAISAEPGSAPDKVVLVVERRGPVDRIVLVSRRLSRPATDPHRRGVA